MAYASRTGTRRNLDALRAAGWGLLISRNGEWRTEGFADYVLDCGTWGDHQLGRAWDDGCAAEYEALLDLLGAGCAWAVLPDIVAGGLASLELSLRYQNRALSAVPKVLIAVQDGMKPADLAPFVGPQVGIFMGGSTEWKIRQMREWGVWCAGLEIDYHVARVNTLQRFGAAADAGATSIDGSSGSRFAKNVPKLDRWRRTPSLVDPRR